jgi:hypothetical protein
MAALPLGVGLASVAGWPAHRVGSDTIELESPEIRGAQPWRELVVSWNVEPADDAGISVAAQGLTARGATRFYRLGDWSLDPDAPLARTSVRAEADAEGEVRTDTLVLRDAAEGVRVRLTLRGALARHPDRLRLLTVSVCDPSVPAVPRAPRRDVWGTSLAVPERSQVSYPGGEGWCSPTTVSMVLAWWARELHRPGLDRDVAEVAAGVHDPAWGGTGNWPFNTAYAGSLASMRACAARLRDLRAVEDLVAAGIPVVLSVNAPALRDRGTERSRGHLIVAVGFTASGDLVANDPWARLEEGQRVRRIYPRENVEQAWKHAHQLAYLIAPADRLEVFPVDWQ